MNNTDLSPALSNPITEARFAPVYQILADAIQNRAFPGCAFGVLSGGTVVLQDALGRFTYDEAADSVTPETAFDIASITKVVATTAAAMLLYQRGVLELDTLLGELLPGFVVGRSPGEFARHVKIRHLLSHNSGLPGYIELFRTSPTPDALYRACLQLPLEAEPGARAEYSDPGFILLGKALEVLTRTPLDSFVDDEIVRPLGLSSTAFNPPNRARPFIPPTEDDTTFRHRSIQGEVQDENAWVLKGVAGHAGLFSNVPDLLRFSHEILGASLVGSADPTIFTRESVQVFAERQGPPGSSRALGWDAPSADSSAGNLFSSHSIGHLGFSGCSLWIDLDASIVAVLLTNRTWPDRQSQLIRQVRPAYHNAVRNALLESHK